MAEVDSEDTRYSSSSSWHVGTRAAAGPPALALGLALPPSDSSNCHAGGGTETVSRVIDDSELPWGRRGGPVPAASGPPKTLKYL